MAEDSLGSGAGGGAGSGAAGGSSTYEATMARQSTRTHPDKIHWDEGNSFRHQPYRNLHHQRGLIGIFNVRLLEASDLKRSYWSPLALGPVKHLGWSKAHGPISAYCTLGLDFSDPHDDYDDDYYSSSSLLASSNSNAQTAAEKALAFHRAASSSSSGGGDGEKKPAAKEQQQKQDPNIKQHAVSPVVHNDNNPVWENVQYEFPLVKGSMARDGMHIYLSVRVHEEATAVEHFLPGIASGGDSRLLGVGKLNVTELCLGQTTRTGQPLPGVLDAWIPITLFRKHDEHHHQHQQHQQEFAYDKNDPLAPPASQHQNAGDADKKKESENKSNITGMVRVLVSYKPHGLEPQPKDVIALEAFARRNPATSTCRPLIPPLMPMTVLERRGPYLLVTYVADSDIHSMHGNGHGSTSSTNFKACVRLHRNACFVIERQNLMDAAHNLALLPADVWMSTPVGKAVQDLTSPLVAASRELFMPAMLSFKLLWLAVRTTSLAGLSGVQALSSTFWHEGSHSLTASHHSSLDMARTGVGVVGGGNSGRHHHDRSVATAQFVQL